MSLEEAPEGRIRKGTAVIEWQYSYRFSVEFAMAGGK
jgi:hypothetical protein